MEISLAAHPISDLLRPGYPDHRLLARPGRRTLADRCAGRLSLRRDLAPHVHLHLSLGNRVDCAKTGGATASRLYSVGASVDWSGWEGLHGRPHTRLLQSPHIRNFTLFFLFLSVKTAPTHQHLGEICTLEVLRGE